MLDKYNKIYNLNKNGLINGNKKKCICGEELDENIKTCPKCGLELTKNKLLNVSKNNSLKKRFNTKIIPNDYYCFEQINLMCTGFDLYETPVCKFEIKLTPITSRAGANLGSNIEVKITNTKQFKIISKNDVFIGFMEKYFPDFIEYTGKCLNELDFEYAKSQFGSLTESELTNFFNVWINYNALKDYFLGYKVYYFGNKINLKKYFPETDFNNPLDVNKVKLNLDLLKTWDIKNINYIEKIIEYSKDENISQKLSLIRKTISIYNPNQITDIFEYLYNEEISLKDFIRLFDNNPKDFIKIKDYHNFYKKINGKIDWSKIENFNDYNFLAVKDYMKTKLKMNKKQLDDFYSNLNINPIDTFLNL